MKSKQNKLVHSFFGRIYGAPICLRFYLTFRAYLFSNHFKGLLAFFSREQTENSFETNANTFSRIIHCPKMKMNEKKPSQFEFQFPGLTMFERLGAVSSPLKSQNVKKDSFSRIFSSGVRAVACCKETRCGRTL